jgi:DnaK suppressor protein
MALRQPPPQIFWHEPFYTVAVQLNTRRNSQRRIASTRTLMYGCGLRLKAPNEGTTNMRASKAKTSTAPMTEKEILSAPESDYMSVRQLDFFRRRLQEEKNQLLSNAQETTTHLQDNESTPDPSDRASVEEEHTLELRVRDRERKLLKKIEEAIARIDAGEYGYCEETGEPIGIARLLARPTATLSIEAQERREKLKKMHGG